MFGCKKSFLHRNNVPGRLKGLVHLFQPMLHLFGIKSRDFAVNDYRLRFAWLAQSPAQRRLRKSRANVEPMIDAAATRLSYFPAQKSELHFLIEPSNIRESAPGCRHRRIDELWNGGM